MGNPRVLRQILLSSTGEVGTAYGTTGAPTYKLSSITDASLKPADKTEVIPNIGNLGPGPTAVLVAQSAETKVSGVASYEDLSRILNGFMTAVAASTGNSTGGTSAGFIYNYTAPIASTQAVYTYPMELSILGSTVAYMAYGNVFSKLELKGEAGNVWEYSVDALAKLIATSTISSITAPSTNNGSINSVRMADTKLYIDSFTGTVGNTTASNSLINFSLSLDTKRHLKTFGGSLTPTDWGEDKWSGSLKVVAEFNSFSKPLVDALLGSTAAMVQRLIRVEASQGSSATLKTVTIDFAGTKVGGETLWSDREGNATVELQFEGTFSTAMTSTGNTSGNWLKFQVVNGSSSTT